MSSKPQISITPQMLDSATPLSLTSVKKADLGSQKKSEIAPLYPNGVVPVGSQIMPEGFITSTGLLLGAGVMWVIPKLDDSGT